MRLDRLKAHHVLTEFNSGNDELDTWLQRHALAAQHMDSARTFVLTRDDHVVGYFSLAMGSVLRSDAPAKLVRGLPGYPVGMALLERLASTRVIRAPVSARCCSPKLSARRSRRAKRPPLGW